MTPLAAAGGVSVIVPTIGRPESLRRLLESLCVQTLRPDEVLVADASDDEASGRVAAEPRWGAAGLRVERIDARPANAARQRIAAIARARGECLLLLDDDVALEPECLERMAALLRADAGIAAVCADFNNHAWPMPTRAWRFYLRHALGLEAGAWQGRVVGPLLRFGFAPVPAEPRAIEWFGTGHTLLRRSAYDAAGGLSGGFLHRSTTHEDVDLALRVSKVGRIVFCPAARMGHFHEPAGRVTPMVAAEDDLYNRFVVMRRAGRSAPAAFGQALAYFVVETSSNLAGCLRRLSGDGFGARLAGRLRALARIALALGRPA